MVDKKGNFLSIGNIVVTDINDTGHRGVIKDVYKGQVFVKWVDGGGGWIDPCLLIRVELRS